MFGDCILMSERIKISDKFTFGKLIRFAVPSMIMVIFMSLYGIIDGLFVSNFVGGEAFTAVNLFLPVFYLVGSVGLLLGSGGCAFIAKLFGEKNEDAARRHFTGLIIIVTCIGVCLTAAMIGFMPDIASALGATGNVKRLCSEYGTVMICGLVPYILQSFFQYFFAVADRPKLGLAITVGAGAVNALGDLVFIYAADMGVIGAAAATVIGECVGAFIPLAYFLVKKNKRLYIAKPKFEPRSLGKVCVNGSSELLSGVSAATVNMLYNFQLLKYVGTDGVVAFGVIMYISFIFIGCYLGFTVGTAPIIGYNYGAKNTEEMRSVFKKSLLFIAVSAAVMTAVSVSTAKPLASIFVSGDPKLLGMTTTALRIYSVSFLLSGFNIYASGFFTALNNGIVSATISASRTLLFQIAAVFVLPLIFGLNGIWGATAVAELLSLAVSLTFIILKRKKYGYI